MRTRPRKTARTAIAPALNPAPHCWSLIPIDGEPIRKKARRDYDKVLRDLEKCKLEIERFETEDNPGFLRWLNSTFGALITEARELNERLLRSRSLVYEVQQEHFYGAHSSIVEAYKKVLERRQEEENAPPPDSSKAAGEDPDFKTEEDFFAEAEQRFREFASSIGFDIPEEDEEDVSPQATKEKPRNSSPRVKDLYRAIVRRLHPDKASNLSPKEIEWWHQAQAAYQAGSVEQLELILTLCEIEDRGMKETSVSLLGQIVSHFKTSLRSLKRRLTQCKRDPAWGFTKLPDRSELHRKVEATFRAEREMLQSEVRQYELLLQKWEAQAAVPREKTRSRARAATYREQELFF